MLGYYIYYKVDVGQLDATRKAARALLTEIARLTGVTGRLMARTDDALTWMEIYEPIVDPAAFDRALAAALQDAGLLALLVSGKRVTERFESL